jgi:hypothetical protein
MTGPSGSEKRREMGKKTEGRRGGVEAVYYFRYSNFLWYYKEA